MNATIFIKTALSATILFKSLTRSDRK